MRTTVIGATSPLGIRLVKMLGVAGNEVYATFRNSTLVPDSWRLNPSIRLKEVKLDEQPDLGDTLQETVIWLAHLDQGRFNERETQVNLAAFRHFLEQARRADTRRIIFISSGGSVYGTPSELPIAEDHPRNPISSYGKAKLALEDELTAFAEVEGVETAIIRPGNVYGFESNRKSCKGVVGALLRAIETGTPFTMIHNGRTIRDFIHADDVNRAIQTAMESKRSRIVWNVATGRGTKTADVVNLVLEAAGRPDIEILNVENYPSDVLANVLSIDRITKESDWGPQIELKRGIEAIAGRL